jgi:PAS domain S-box-containing protein
MTNSSALSSFELSHLILNQSPDAVVFADLSGRIQIWNPAAEALFGITAAEAVGQSLDLIIPEKFRKAHWLGYERSLASGETKYSGRVMTTRSIHKARDPFYIDMSFAIVKAESGEIVGVLATARDATDRFLAEREMKKRLAELEQTTKL